MQSDRNYSTLIPPGSASSLDSSLLAANSASICSSTTSSLLLSSATTVDVMSSVGTGERLHVHDDKAEDAGGAVTQVGLLAADKVNMHVPILQNLKSPQLIEAIALKARILAQFPQLKEVCINPQALMGGSMHASFRLRLQAFQATHTSSIMMVRISLIQLYYSTAFYSYAFDR